MTREVRRSIQQGDAYFNYCSMYLWTLWQRVQWDYGNTCLEKWTCTSESPVPRVGTDPLGPRPLRWAQSPVVLKLTPGVMSLPLLPKALVHLVLSVVHSYCFLLSYCSAFTKDPSANTAVSLSRFPYNETFLSFYSQHSLCKNNRKEYCTNISIWNSKK